MVFGDLLTTAPLTAKQGEILAYIRRSVRDGAPPTYEEIAEEFGFKVRASARDHVQALEKKGYLRLIPGRSRGIHLIDRDPGHGGAMLPLVGAIAAGKPILAEENVARWVSIGPELFRPRADFLYEVIGTSMNRVAEPGDLVGIRVQSIAEPGQIVAAALLDPGTGGELITLKRLARRGSTFVLKPDSTDSSHKPIEIESAHFGAYSQAPIPFRIVGVLCSGLFRSNRVSRGRQS